MGVHRLVEQDRDLQLRRSGLTWVCNQGRYCKEAIFSVNHSKGLEEERHYQFSMRRN